MKLCLSFTTNIKFCTSYADFVLLSKGNRLFGCWKTIDKCVNDMIVNGEYRE